MHLAKLPLRIFVPCPAGTSVASFDLLEWFTLRSVDRFWGSLYFEARTVLVSSEAVSIEDSGGLGRAAWFAERRVMASESLMALW